MELDRWVAHGAATRGSLVRYEIDVAFPSANCMEELASS